MQIKLFNKDQGIFVFHLDQKRFIDKTKSIRGGIPILFPICGNLNTSSSVFGRDYLQLSQHGFARDLQWQYTFNENEKSLCLFLNESKKTKKYYPFDFELIIKLP